MTDKEAEDIKIETGFHFVNTKGNDLEGYIRKLKVHNYIIFKSKFNIGDKVYHNTPDSDQGIVLDISYSVRYKECTYKVAFGRREEDTVWCIEDELSFDKIIV